MEEAGRRDSTEERRGRGGGGDGQIRRIGGQGGDIWKEMRRGGLQRSDWKDVMWKLLEKFFFLFKEERGREVREVWGLKQFLAFCERGRDLQDFINSVNLRTLVPKRFGIRGLNNSVCLKTLASRCVWLHALVIQRLLFEIFSTQLPAFLLHTDLGRSLIFVSWETASLLSVKVPLFKNSRGGLS